MRETLPRRMIRGPTARHEAHEGTKNTKIGASGIQHRRVGRAAARCAVGGTGMRRARRVFFVAFVTFVNGAVGSFFLPLCDTDRSPVHSSLEDVLSRYWGFTAFRPLQRA